MNVKRTLCTALAGLALSATACSGGGQAASVITDQIAPTPAPVAAAPATPTPVAPADAVNTNPKAATPSASELAELTTDQDVADAFQEMERVGALAEQAATLSEALDLMGQIVILLDTHPAFAGGEPTTFDTSDLGEIAAQFGVTEDEVLKEMYVHPVLGPVLMNSESDTSESASEGDWVSIGYSSDDEWADDDFDSVFVDRALAEAHTGPWGDHARGRCTSWDRSVQPIGTWSSDGGSTSNGDLVDASVTIGAAFEDEAAAQQAFDEIGVCHVPASVNQFLEALGFGDWPVEGLGVQWYETDGRTEILLADYLDQDLPVGFAAILSGDTVIISINFGYGIDRAVEEAFANLG
ncbi:MAG: hypothetical protein ACI8Y4_004396 [Candidatus Poriferisodalaceae bacterium]|jgi:hypothetical protein